MSTETELTDSEMAGRVLDWFYLLVTLRIGAKKGLDAETLVEQLERADPEQLKQAHRWLGKFLIERSDVKIEKLQQRKHAVIAAASRKPKFTRREYAAAMNKVGPKQMAVAAELKVDAKTLRTTLREWKKLS